MQCGDLGFLRSSLHTYGKHRVCPPVLNFTELVLGCGNNVDPSWAQDVYVQLTGLNPDVVATLWKSYLVESPIKDPYSQETFDELKEVQLQLEDNQESLLNILKNGYKSDFFYKISPSTSPSPVHSSDQEY